VITAVRPRRKAYLYFKERIGIIMTCYHPLKAFATGERTKNGKISYIVTGYDAKAIIIDGKGRRTVVDRDPGFTGDKILRNPIEIQVSLTARSHRGDH
jgi:hypothetical protein